MADHFLPPDIHLAHLLVVPLAFAAVLTDFRRTAVTAVLAVAGLLAAAVERNALTTESVLVELLSLVLISLLLLLVVRLRDEHRIRLAAARRVSEITQAVLMPQLPRHAGAVSVAATYASADTEARIGGDLYAIARTPKATRLIIGDARGKGLAAIGDVATVLGAFRLAAHRPTTLSRLAAHLEASFGHGLAAETAAGGEGGTDERFVTAALLEIPDDAPYARLISFGHTPPVLLRDGTATAIEVPDPAPPLGLTALAPAVHGALTFRFAPGDSLLLYTDGLTESRDAAGAFYPLVERAAAWAGEHPEALVERIGEDVRAHRGAAQHDDMAIVALRRNHCVDGH
ncbi:PP2C family protein-serine/threonine phosphatase [Streptomyces sp. NPDC004065]|uniref:PP2C family protein-serine/threonine phosphatase n=1 Tax=Streptomyces sp. NPDC004065 TaxID=3364689 RepID=UPI003851260E